MGTLYVAIASFGGGIVSALLGWISSGENFVARKFASSVLRALIAGGAFATAYSVASGVATGMDIAIAFGAGAGIDALGHRVAKIK